MFLVALLELVLEQASLPVPALLAPNQCELLFLGYIVRFNQPGTDIGRFSQIRNSPCLDHLIIGTIGAIDVAFKSIGGNYIVTLANVQIKERISRTA